MRSKLLLLAIFFLSALGSIAQPYYFRHYQVEDGLSNNAVVCCLQDSKGFLWFGTKDGLDRFDGYTFKIFRNDPDDKNSIGSNFIHALYADKNNILWVGTDRGLYKYDETTERFTLLPTPDIQQVTDITMDKAGNLWFISNFILFKYHIVNKVLTPFPIETNFEATSICTLEDGSVWVAASNGLLQKYNAAGNNFSGFDLFSHSAKSVSNWIEPVYGTSDGNILVGTSNQGVKQFFPATGTYKDVLTYNADKTEIFARAFVQTGKDECWIATETGIYIYNVVTGSSINLHKEYHDQYSISDNAVYAFCEDREGGIWACTYFGGINYYPRQPITFQKYFPDKDKNSITGNVVREVHEDRNGNVWIGTEDGGLTKLNTTTGLFKNFMPTGLPDAISYTNIHGILPVNDELWIGTFEHGLDVMNLKTEKVVRHYSKGTDSGSLKSNFIYCLYQSSQGEIMIGTTVGAYTYNRATDNFSEIPGMPLHRWYSSILKDKHAVIWGGTYGNGVNFYDTKTKTSGNFIYDAQNKNSISSDRINNLFEDSNNNLWLATEGGLCRYYPATKTFKRYNTSNGFPANFILSIAEDNHKILWVSTSKGLVSFNPLTEKIQVYTKANGILNDQFNFSSAFKDSKGTMYFGSVKGLISFHPDKIIASNYSPSIYITGFQVNNKELGINKAGSPLTKTISLTDKIILPYNESTFSIDFASLSYTAPEMSEYAYKMEGLSGDWTFLKTNRKVYFTDLSPGTYTFKVKSANSMGSWDVKEASLLIEILPPWWAGKWAYTAYTLMAALLTFFITRFYHLRIKEKNKRKIEQLEVAKEKELYEAKMQFFTNVAHEIKTPLTLIKGPLEKVIKKAGEMPDIKSSLRIMEKNTERLVDLTNQLLDFRQTEINGFSLTFTKENIIEITEEIFTAFKPLAEQKDIHFTLKLPLQEIFAFIDVDAFNKILTNLLSNAVKYASTKAAVQVLPVNAGDQFFTIEVRNDGYLIPAEMKEKIFEPFFRLKETEKQKGTGIGLALSRSLTQLHKGLLELKETENDMNVFLISIPLNQNA